MGSSYFGEPNLGSERSGSSRKGKKGNSEKPKQPQRGLGVAQLEKIRLQSQLGCSYLPSPLQPPYPTNPNQEDLRMQTAYSSAAAFSYTSQSSSSSYGFHGRQGMMMGVGELDCDSQPNTNARWNPGNTVIETQHFAQPNITRPLLNLEVEESREKKKKKDRGDSLGSSSQNSESSGSQELDLELRLSL